MSHMLRTVAEMDEKRLVSGWRRRIRPHLSEVNDRRASRHAEWGQIASIRASSTVLFPLSCGRDEGGEQGDPLMPLLFCLGQH